MFDHNELTQESENAVNEWSKLFDNYDRGDTLDHSPAADHPDLDATRCVYTKLNVLIH